MDAFKVLSAMSPDFIKCLQKKDPPRRTAKKGPTPPHLRTQYPFRTRASAMAGTRDAPLAADPWHNSIHRSRARTACVLETCMQILQWLDSEEGLEWVEKAFSLEKVKRYLRTPLPRGHGGPGWLSRA